MDYISTRGEKKKLNFSDVLLSGLAKDGGLYIPKKWPKFLAKDIKRLKKKKYNDIAFEVSRKFIGNEINKKELKKIINNSLKKFSNKEIAKIRPLSNYEWLLELHYGPTLAFKDYALQIVGNLLDYTLKSKKKRITIIGATSGDTGAAAIDACKDKDTMEVFIFHPKGKISKVQRKLMTTVNSKNIHNIAINGDFDDCQKIIKKLFIDPDLKSKFNFTAINSINWARILFQTIYYFFSITKIKRNKNIIFSVPSGNFGNIYSGYVAKKIGLQFDKLIIATNSNDILSTFTNKGVIRLKSVKHTITPSMDIQLPSNLERFIFDLFKSKTKNVNKSLKNLFKNKRMDINKEKIKQIQKFFYAKSVSEKETIEMIKEIFIKNKVIIDPHTAVGIAAGRKLNKKKQPIVYISTAHPSKFPDIVKKSINQYPELPRNLIDLYKKKEKYKTIDLNYFKIKDYLLKQSDFISNV